MTTHNIYRGTGTHAVGHFASRRQIGPRAWLVFGPEFPYVERYAPGSDDMIREPATARDLQLAPLLEWYEGLPFKRATIWGRWAHLELAPTSAGRWVVVAHFRVDDSTVLLESLREARAAVFHNDAAPMPF